MLFVRTPRARILMPLVLLVALAAVGVMALQRIARAVTAEARTRQAQSRTPVIVELFTSEGCSSCPPADALLAKLQQSQPVESAEIIALEEHVDYWDGLGWHDRFSLHQITDRQSAYAQRFQLDSNYTPQIVVDGVTQFVGTDRSQAVQAITRAARASKPALSIEALLLNENGITGQVVVPSSAPRGSDLYATLVQPSASTQVLHGENGGHTLNHFSVVRALSRTSGVSPSTRLDFSLAVPKDLRTADLRVVVFLQTRGQGAILAAASAPLPQRP